MKVVLLLNFNQKLAKIKERLKFGLTGPTSLTGSKSLTGPTGFEWPKLSDRPK